MPRVKEPSDLLVFRPGEPRIIPYPKPGPGLSLPQELLVPGEIGKAEDGVPAMLLGPEEVPLATDLEVGPGYLEPVVGGPEDLQTLLGHFPGMGDEDTPALVPSPPHPPPELMEL